MTIGKSGEGASTKETARALTFASFFVSKEAVAGAVGGCATRLLCQPFDVLKIRFQVKKLSLPII